MARLQGVYKLPNGSIPKGGKIRLRVPRDRNTTGGAPYTLPAKTVDVPIDATTGAYDSGTIPDGPYQVRRVITGAPTQGSNGGWSDVILSGTTDLQTAIDTYDPTSYTPPVVSAAQAAAAQAAQSAAAAEAAAEQVTGGVVATDNGDGTFSLSSSTGALVDHGDGTWTLTT